MLDGINFRKRNAEPSIASLNYLDFLDVLMITKILPCVLAITVMGVFMMPLSYSDYPSPAQQIRDGVEPDDIQCNADRIHVIRTNGNHVCVNESTAQRMGWAIVLVAEVTSSEKATSNDDDDHTDIISKTNDNDELLILNAVSPVEFVDDGRELEKGALQRAPPPQPAYDSIVEAMESGLRADADGLIRVPTGQSHEKYSLNPGTGFYAEDWFPTYIPDGQKLLYSKTFCYPSGSCTLSINFVPNTFVLHENITDYDLWNSKGFRVTVNYSPTPQDEIEDVIEEAKEIDETQPRSYGGYTDMTRDGKTVYAYAGGNAVNPYQALLSYRVDENTNFYVKSFYHTLDELLPIFNSVGN